MTTNIAGSPITGIDITCYLIGDAKRSIAFYRDTLGLVPNNESDRGAEFELPDGSTFGVWVPDEGQAPKGAAVMFRVEDIAAAVEQLRARGAQVSDPDETPVCFMAFASDPDGNMLVIHQRK